MKKQDEMGGFSTFNDEIHHSAYEERECEKKVWIWVVAVLLIVALFAWGVNYQIGLHCQGDITICSN